MTDRELTGKVHSAVYHQCQRRGYAAPVDVLMEIGVMPKEKYEDWRRGRIDYLERVCTVNLRKLSFIMREIRAYAQKSGLKPSVTVYKQWAVKKKSGQGHILKVDLCRWLIIILPVETRLKPKMKQYEQLLILSIMFSNTIW